MSLNEKYPAQINNDQLITSILSHDPQAYYDILGTSISVSNKDLKQIYKRLLIQLHPDKNRNSSSNSKEAFARVQKAYQILNNDTYKSFYDKYGKDPLLLLEKIKNQKLAKDKSHKRDPQGEILNLFLDHVETDAKFVIYQNTPKKREPKQNTLNTLTLLFPLIVICLLPILELLFLDAQPLD
ncbi:hypothetical protein MOSE0_C05644 [Monosporozyma servazzii]